jgi:integrase
LATYRDHRSSEVAPQTVKHEINLVRRVIKLAIAEWGLGLAEVPYVRLPRLPIGRDRRLPSEEITALLTCLSDQMRDIVRFALETAMRRSEILGIAPDDFDAQSKTVTLRDTKNGRARTIPLSCTALAILNRRTQDGTIFTMQPDSVSQALRRACSKTQIKDYRFHDLRHEAISRLFERGLSVPQVALISGHQDYRMLARYVHLHNFEL